MPNAEPSRSFILVASRVAAAWGIGGVLLLLVDAVARLAPRALEALRMELSVVQWGALAVWLVFMAYVEGWRGFHLKLAPRVVERAADLRDEPTALRGLLAPLYCMSLFAAPRREMAVSWGLVVGIVALVLVVRFLPQPWRGIVDAGVVVGLSIGAGSILAHAVRAARRQRVDSGVE